MCIRGSSPETLNLKQKERFDTAVTGGGGLIHGYEVLPGHPGVLLYHTFAQLYSEVHWLEDVLYR